MPPSTVSLPVKSIATALLFCVVLGPFGLLYSSLTGGVVTMLAALLVIRSKALILLLLVWFVACFWGVAAANRYNDRLLDQFARSVTNAGKKHSNETE